MIIFAVYLYIESLFGTYYKPVEILNSIFLHGEVDLFVPYSWYIFVIIVFYIVFKLLMLIFGKHYKLMIIGGIIWNICHVLICRKLSFGGWWYITSFILVVGMAWAVYEKKIISLFENYYILFAVLILIAFILSYSFTDYYINKVNPDSRLLGPLGTMATNMFFVLCVIVFLMKVKIGNRISAFLGEISLEIYITQGIWTKYLLSDIFSNLSSYLQKPLVWTFLTLILTIITSYLFHLFNQLILKNYKKLFK